MTMIKDYGLYSCFKDALMYLYLLLSTLKLWDYSKGKVRSAEFFMLFILLDTCKYMLNISRHPLH